MVIAFLLAAALARPSAEALRLGKELARHGTLATLLPMMKAKEIDELLSDHPKLSASEQASLRGTAEQVFDRDRDRLLTATGVAYARALSVGDLRKALDFYRSPAGARFEAALPAVVGGAVAGAGKLDFKGDVLAAYCKQTGKLCGK